MSAGSIYRVEGGVAVPYANLGSGSDKTYTDVSDQYESSLQDVTGIDVAVKVSGDVTELSATFAIGTSENTHSFSQGSTDILSIVSGNTNNALRPFQNGTRGKIDFTGWNYLLVEAPFVCSPYIKYDGTIGLEVQTGGGTYNGRVRINAIFLNKS